MQSANSTLIKTKFFTANIKAKFATNGQKAQLAQQNYHRALTTIYPKEIEIIKGFYSSDKSRAMTYQEPPEKTSRVDIWKLEEKQTDVNIALQAYRDASFSRAEQIVFVTNDTDIAPAINAIKCDFPEIIIGLILPLRENKKRPANAQLSKNVHWTRKYLLNTELAAAQLPTMIPTKKKPIFKPDYW